MDNLTVVARFVRIQGLILDVADISSVWDTHNYNNNPDLTRVTRIRMKTGETCHELSGHVANEVWEILQAGSTAHLDPHDMLREKVCL